MAEQFTAMEQKIADLESRTVRQIGSETPSRVIARVASDEELTDFQRELVSRTRETPKDFQREGISYNFPLKWFAKPDGSIVQLQSDPQNRAYYQDKGFSLLDADQERRWLSIERPRLLQVQQEKAHLINSLRTARDLDPVLKLNLPPQIEVDWDHMTVAELRNQMAEINRLPTADGRPRIKLERLKRLQDQDDRHAQAEGDALLRGVETGTNRESFEQRVSRGREIELTPATAGTFA